MATSVKLNENQVRELDRLARETRKSRASLVQDALSDYLAKHRHRNRDDAFGLWGDQQIDGLQYQEKVRSEW